MPMFALFQPWTGIVAACVVAATLLWAAVGKVTGFSDFTGTIQAVLGLPGRRTPARALAAAVVVAEVVAVIACLGGLRTLAALTVTALGLAFAGAGVLALTRGQAIACNCFGGTARDRRLGWPQVLLLPLWLLAAWAIAAPRPGTGPGPAEVITLFVVLALALIRAALPAVRVLRDLRHERLLFGS